MKYSRSGKLLRVS